MNRSNHSGFTLIELMIAVAIVGILSAVATYAYRDYTLKAWRTEGRGALMDLANRMEKYYLDNNTYAGATIAGVGASVTTTPQGAYTLSILSQDASSYSLRAVPIFINDPKCTAFTLNSAGTRTYTGTGSNRDCW